ncbi:MAG: segregation and condensation protein A [Solirubrobacteraceae bacterium]
MTLTYLDLDLDVFAGPFDLLLTLILREEVDLLEVDLAEVVIAYIDHLERRGELDLEAATEFLVLIAALLELKSRLLLPGEELEELELDPGEAAEELLARLLAAQRYRAAAEYLSARLDEESCHRFRSAPLPPALRKSSLRDAGAVYEPVILATAIGELLQVPPPVDIGHITVAKVTVAERLAHLRALLSHGGFTFSEAVGRADRVTVAVTLYALLELYTQGEATWTQAEPFAEIEVSGLSARPSAGGLASRLSA